MQRSRPLWLVLIVLVMGLGLASRHFRASLPSFIAEYSGDTLWALMVFLITGFLWAKGKTVQVAGAALAFAYAIEISQLYHAPWIDAIRHTTLGALVLGFGFLWSDLVCYTVGVGIGAALDFFSHPLPLPHQNDRGESEQYCGSGELLQRLCGDLTPLYHSDEGGAGGGSESGSEAPRTSS